MPDYRRSRIPGGCYFFTVNLLERRKRLLTEHIEPGRVGNIFSLPTISIPHHGWMIEKNEYHH